MAKGLYKMKMMSDTTKPKMDTLMKFKRMIGDTAAQMKKAEKLGLSNQDLKSRLAEKLKAKKG